MSDAVNGPETSTLPMFPLNTVLFPGVSVPLHVFEDRYRALVHHLLRIEDPAMRIFGTVGIREGYEVGERGAQSLYRIGTRLQLTEVVAHPDGTFEITAVGRDRFRLEGLGTTGEFPVGEVTLLPPDTEIVPDEIDLVARATFTAFRAMVSQLRSDPYPGDLPGDPEFLSWTLAGATPLPMAERQSLLEAETAPERLAMLIDYLRSELEAMNVIPSLPATEVARTGWSPN